MSEPLDLRPIKARLAEYMATGPADSPDRMGTDLSALIAEVERLRKEAGEMAEWAIDGAMEYGRQDLAARFQERLPPGHEYR